MFNREFRWERALIATIISIALLFSGYLAYQKFLVQKPLEGNLDQKPFVISSAVEQKDGVYVAEVFLDDVTDLKEYYDEMCRELKETLGPKPFKLIIQDNPDDTLESAFQAIHYYIYEAAGLGNFGEMAKNSEKLLLERDIDDYKITVDDLRIYVQLKHGGKYLYRIVERGEPL